MKMSYFPGCTLKNKATVLDEYARSCAEALGVTLEEIEKSAKEKKHEFLQRTKDKIADVERAICVANGELKKEEEKKTKDKKRIKELKEYIKVQSQDLKRLKEVN